MKMKKRTAVIGLLITSFMVGLSIFSYFYELQPKTGPIGDGPDMDKLLSTLLFRLGTTIPFFVFYLISLINIVAKQNKDPEANG